jgi:hypothetical protein
VFDVVFVVVFLCDLGVDEVRVFEVVFVVASACIFYDVGYVCKGSN